LKKLLIVGALLASVISSQALTATLTTTSTTATNLILGTNGAIITSVRVSGVAGSVSFALFDFPNITLSQTNGNFTNVLVQSTNTSRIYTNYTGVLETNTYPIVTNIPIVTVAATNLPPRILYITGATNTTISAGSLQQPYIAVQGIVVTNTGAGTLSIDYIPYR